MVRAEDSRTLNQEDVGSIPDTVYWMDVSVASYYIERKDNKGSQMRHTKKIFKKKIKNIFQIWISHQQQSERGRSASSLRTLWPFRQASDRRSGHAEPTAIQNGLQGYGVQAGRPGKAQGSSATTASNFGERIRKSDAKIIDLKIVI